MFIEFKRSSSTNITINIDFITSITPEISGTGTYITFSNGNIIYVDEDYIRVCKLLEKISNEL